MKRLILIILTVLLGAWFILRLVQTRNVAEVKTIAQLQAESGYPVQVETAELRSFTKTLSYAGNIHGGEETSVVSSLGEYVAAVPVREGTRVSKDQIICELFRSNLASGYTQAKLALENAETELQRVQRLFDEGAISKQMLDGATLARDLAAEGMRSSETLLFIRSPIDGVVTHISAEQGMWVAPGQMVVKVVSTDALRVQFEVPGDDRVWIKPGVPAEVEFSGNRFKGRVSRVSGSADPESRTFTAWIKLDQAFGGADLTPGLLVDITLQVADLQQALTLSNDAILREGEARYIYAVENGKALRRPVTIGGSNRQFTWIKDGLTLGAVVVNSGASLLADGVPVRIITL